MLVTSIYSRDITDITLKTAAIKEQESSSFTTRLNNLGFTLTVYQTTNFSQGLIQSIFRRQNNRDSEIEIGVGKSRKYCGNRRKCWLPAFCPVPTRFSKSQGCSEKGYNM